MNTYKMMQKMMLLVIILKKEEFAKPKYAIPLK